MLSGKIYTHIPLIYNTVKALQKKKLTGILIKLFSL